MRILHLPILIGLIGACGTVEPSRCTLVEQGESTVLRCDDGTETRIPTAGPPGPAGEPGRAGMNGTPGTGCTVSADAQTGVVRIECPDGTSAEVPPGQSCTVSANRDGSVTIACEDGSEVVIGRTEPEFDGPSLEALSGVISVGSNDGLATETRMDGALHAAFSPDGSFLYFVDTFNRTIRRFGLITGRVVTLAGTPGADGVDDGVGAAARFQGPRGIAIDPSGQTLYIADGFNCTLRTLDIQTREVRTLVGVPRECGFADGNFQDARIGLTIGMAMRDERYVYFADRGANRIRRVDLVEQRVETIAGGARGYADGPGVDARFAGPGGIDFDADGTHLWVNDTFNQTIRRIALTSTTGAPAFTVETVAGEQGSPGHVDGPGTEARFSISQGIAFARDGVYVAGFHDTIRRIDPLPPYTVRTVAGRNGTSGSVDGHPSEARFGVAFGIHAHPDGERLFYMDRGNDNIREFHLEAERVTTVMGAPQPTGWRDGADARFQTPSAVLSSPDGSAYYIADEFNHVVRRYDVREGAVETLAGLPGVSGHIDGTADSARFDRPVALALASDGRTLYVSEWGNHAVRTVNVETLAVQTLAGGPDRRVEFEDGEPAAGTVLEGSLTEARFGRLTGLALDAARQRLYVSDHSLDQIRTIDLAAESVSFLVGGGSPPLVPRLDEGGNPVLGPDGQPELIPAEEYEPDGVGDAAIFVGPYGLALDAAGENLFVADRSHHLVRRVAIEERRVTTVAGEYGVSGAFDDVGLDAAFNSPASVSLSDDGQRLYVVDRSNHAVRRIVLSTRRVDTVLGDLGVSGGTGLRVSSAQTARLYFPGFAVVEGDDLVLTARNALLIARGVAAETFERQR